MEITILALLNGQSEKAMNHYLAWLKINIEIQLTKLSRGMDKVNKNI